MNTDIYDGGKTHNVFENYFEDANVSMACCQIDRDGSSFLR